MTTMTTTGLPAKRRVDVDAVNSDGWTALRAAADAGHADCILLLLPGIYKLDYTRRARVAPLGTLM